MNGLYIISDNGEIILLPRYKQNNSKLQYVEPKEICRYENPKNIIYMFNYGKTVDIKT